MRMRNEEAIKALKIIASYEDTLDYIKEHSVTVQDACNLAIKTLEAWEKVVEAISLNREHTKLDCFFGQGKIYGLDIAEEIINKHLGEVDDRVTDESIIRTHLEDVVESGFSLDEIANVLEKMRNAK